jgi:hypothetical protein
MDGAVAFPAASTDCPDPQMTVSPGVRSAQHG